jgi:hypothetical protein
MLTGRLVLPVGVQSTLGESSIMNESSKKTKITQRKTKNRFL